MKKKFTLLMLGVVSLIIAVFSIAGCGLFDASPKDFEKAGMKITLTDDFYEKSMLSQTAYYESQKAIVVALKEEFTMADGLSEWTLDHYTSVTMSGNKLQAETHQRFEKDYMYFSYEKSVSGKDFYYLATTHKSGDAFWLIQFACEQSDKDKYTEQFLTWADSITFTATASNAV